MTAAMITMLNMIFFFFSYPKQHSFNFKPTLNSYLIPKAMNAW